MRRVVDLGPLVERGERGLDQPEADDRVRDVQRELALHAHRVGRRILSVVVGDFLDELEVSETGHRVRRHRAIRRFEARDRVKVPTVAPLVERVEEPAARLRRVAERENLAAAGAHALERFPHLARDAARLVDDDENLRAARTAHRVSVLGGEAEELATVRPPDADLRRQRRLRHELAQPRGVVPEPLDFVPEGQPHLALGRRRQHDARATSRTRPPNRERRGHRRLADLVTGATGDAAVRRDRLGEENLLGPKTKRLGPPLEPHAQERLAEALWVVDVLG